MLQALTTKQSPFWIMSQNTGAYLSTLLTAGGAIAFPNVSAVGGSLLGIPNLTTNAISNLVILVDASQIIYARDGAAGRG